MKGGPCGRLSSYGEDDERYEEDDERYGEDEERT
jgi:hypothetical protein